MPGVYRPPSFKKAVGKAKGAYTFTSMQKQVGSFVVEAYFWLTNRGWVLSGELIGQVEAGNQLVFPAGITLLIQSVAAIKMREGEKIGLIISRSQMPDQPDLLEQQVIGFTAQILAQNAG